jgi:cystathionine beta-lyase/cystathionine gamma-synthase
VAALENAKFAYCYSSGVAATDTVMKLLRPGDEVLASDDLYGGTYRIFMRVFAHFGITFKYIKMKDAQAISEHISDKTKLVWIETPSNPLMNIIDIEEVAKITKQKGVWLCADNTFATPYLQNPLDLGADIVLHSATKYLGGHSDVVMGALATNDAALAEQFKFIQNACGAVPGPQDSFLMLRGIKTLHLRVERHCQNGEKIAHYLRNHPKVGHVYWPGFSDHPNHSIAKKQMRGFGGMISFTLKDDSVEQAVKTMESFELFSLAESLGGVESLVCHPASMTHASIPREERLKSGLSDSLIRLSVGVEDADDLIADLAKAIG